MCSLAVTYSAYYIEEGSLNYFSTYWWSSYLARTANIIIQHIFEAHHPSLIDNLRLLEQEFCFAIGPTIH